MSGADTADPVTPAPANLPDGDVSFVAPRTYLEQTKPITPPKPLTALDREQMEGLVRVWHSRLDFSANVGCRGRFAPF